MSTLLKSSESRKPPQSRGERYRWLVLLLAFYTQGNYASTINVLPPILPILIERFGLTYLQSGLIQGVFNLPGAILGIIVGLSTTRLGAKRIGTLGLILLTGGNLIFLTGGSVFQFVLGRFIAGMGASTITVVDLIILTQW